jgi:hypothetical protein
MSYANVLGKATAKEFQRPATAEKEAGCPT